jgi:hypothetical protein
MVRGMTSLFRRLLALAVFALPAVLCAGEPPIIARARARLGGDAVLNELRSLHFYGTVAIADAKEPAKVQTGKIELIFQRPDQQKITLTYDKAVPPNEHPLIETTALDSYEGWSRIADATDATKWKLTLLDAERVKQLRASTWESLYYFRGLERVGGKVEDQGTTLKDGVTCQKIAFIHGPKLVFYRYFDAATGRLVVTETDAGMAIRESGETVVSGIRFPKTTVTSQTAGDKVSTVTITYDRIVVNEAIPAAQFAVPAIRNR